MVTIRGDKVHKRRLQRLRSPEARAAIYRALFAGGQLIEVEAEISITAGSISGKGHIASAPGEPPNADTRALDGGIETVGSPSTMRVTVTSNAPHAADMEFGNSRVEERPYMQPAADKRRDDVVALVMQTVQRLTR
jgi:hypothetical protein